MFGWLVDWLVVSLFVAWLVGMFGLHLGLLFGLLAFLSESLALDVVGLDVERFGLDVERLDVESLCCACVGLCRVVLFVRMFARAVVWIV